MEDFYVIAIEFFKEITLMNKELEYKTVNVDEFVKLCKAGEVYGIFGELKCKLSGVSLHNSIISGVLQRNNS